VVAADDGRTARPWRDLGVHAVLPPGFGPEQLHDVLRTVARPVDRGEAPVAPVGVGGGVDGGVDGGGAGGGPPGGWRGRLVAVTGAGGVGRSTLAMALARGLAADPRDRGLVVLADLALHAHQALLHDAGDVVPGVLELVEAHRAGVLTPEEVRAVCFTVADRGYELLLGLRRQRDWTALRPRATEAALDGLRRTYRHVVADVDADVEGDEQCGSADVEDRNVLARVGLRTAELVLVVGVPGMAGLHSQLRVVRDLLELGVGGARVVPVVNRAPRSPRLRAEVGGALQALLGASMPGVALASSPVFVPERRRLAEALRDDAGPPAPLARPLVGAVRGLLERARHAQAPPRRAATPEPVLVAPGSLGSWSDDGPDG
jgi:hypothetical protein